MAARLAEIDFEALVIEDGTSPIGGKIDDNRFLFRRTLFLAFWR